MNKKSSIRLGPGAPSLILIFVVLSMSVLGMLTLMSARIDLKLSQRSAEAAETVYRLRERAEERRAAVSALLADGGEEALETALASNPEMEGMILEDDRLLWSETDGTRTLSCILRLDGGTTWTAQRLSTNIADDTAEQRETEAKLALADAILARQAALDAMLVRCADGAASWEDYMTRVAAAMKEEPMAEGVTLDGSYLTWIETDGVYRYACTVVIHSLEEERRSDFVGVPVLLEDEEEVQFE